MLNQDFQTPQDPTQAIARFEEHLPLLERVLSQILSNTPASVRDLVYLGAAVLLRCAADWEPNCGLTFKEYAEVAVTSELLHHLHYPVPLLRLPHELTPYQARLNAVAQGLMAMLPPHSMAIMTYPAHSARYPSMHSQMAPPPRKPFLVFALRAVAFLATRTRFLADLIIGILERSPYVYIASV